LFLFLDSARTGLTGLPLFAVRAGTTLAVSVVSFHCLESPIRKGTFLRGLKGVVASPLVVAAVVAALCAGTTVPAFAVKAPPIPPATTLSPATATAAPVDARPTVRALWVGDSTALTLGIALSAEQGAYGVQSADGALVGCGVTDGAEFRLKGVDAPMPPACSGAPSDDSWAQRWRTDIALYQPNVVIILVGRWEVADRTSNGSWTNIEDPAYAAYVKQQLQYATEVAGSGGAHVVLMTAPCYDSGEQPNGDPWPEDSAERLSIYNRIVRQVATSAPHTSLLDLDALVCPGGSFEQSIDGVQIRQPDGVHLALGSGVYLAPRIWPLVASVLTPAVASAGRPG
ncbi:MAG TPA: SGNH/GDSL hydrolase family protein, partial [Acidimicrobiales bacterium]|nr:SGNH/GDSL hydrolase family protein [Acidimicrobiales bacterium]